MFRCIYLVVLRRNYTKKVVLFFNQIDNLKLGFDHNKMCDATFRIKFFLQHFSFKFIRSKLALWQLQGFLVYLHFVYLAFIYPTTIFCTIYFGTSQL